MDVSKWNWGMIGVIFGGVVILIAFYQIVESSEAELRAEMQRIEARQQAEMAELRAEFKAELQRIEAQRQADYAEFKAELAALNAKLDQFIERVDSRLDEVERNQARLDAVTELLAQQIAAR